MLHYTMAPRSRALIVIILTSIFFFLRSVHSVNQLEERDEDQKVVVSMEAGEREAFYQVMESLNYEWDWRSLLPDPCGENTLQGMSCDADGNDQESNTNSTSAIVRIHLTSLSFGQIQVNTPSCSRNASIHPAIASLTHLKSLSFHGCFLTSPAYIPVYLSSLTSLQSLTFQNNPSLVGVIPAEIGLKLAQLERLIITGNPGLHGQLPPELSHLTSLKQLVISRSGVSGQIPAALGDLQTLVILDLSDNRLDSSLPLRLGNLRSLKKLDLSRNWIGGPLESDTVKGLVNLELLDVSRNKLNGSFPEGLLELGRIREIYMNGNSMQGELPRHGWERLGELISLDLTSCGFQGGIPDGLGGLVKTRFVGLGGNRLTGRIPEKLTRLRQLNEINLSDNMLSGPVPFSSDDVRRLGRKLRLENNSGLCFPQSGSESDSDSVSGVGLCAKSSTFPVAFQVDGPSSSSSALKRRYQRQATLVLLAMLVLLSI